MKKVIKLLTILLILSTTSIFSKNKKPLNSTEQELLKIHNKI